MNATIATVTLAERKIREDGHVLFGLPSDQPIFRGGAYYSVKLAANPEDAGMLVSDGTIRALKHKGLFSGVRQVEHA
jgi:hypothetical protein